jgi:O-antigen ligase
VIAFRNNAAALATLATLPPVALMATLALGPQAVLVAMALPLAIAGGLVIVANPFLGVALLILFSQIDALLSLVLVSLPGIKLLTLATLGAALVHMGFARGRRPIGNDPGVGCAVAFCVAVLVSGLLAGNGDLAATGMRRILSMVALYFLVVGLVDTERKIGVALACVIVSTAISAAIVVLDSQFGGSVIAGQAAAEAGEDYRSRGATLGDATTAASILLAGTASAIVLALRGNGRVRMLAGAATAVGLLGIVMSFTRSATLALGLGLAWQVWLRRRDPRIVAVAAIAFIALLFALPAELTSRLGALFGQSHDFTLARRLGYHVIGVELFGTHPIFGIGPANFSAYYTDFDYRWVPGRTLTPRILHNMYLAIAVEAGLLGLASFLGIIGFAVAGCLRAMRRSRTPALALYAESTLFGFALLLLVSATLPNETNKYVWIYAGLATAIARVHARTERRSQLKERPA